MSHRPFSNSLPSLGQAISTAILMAIQFAHFIFCMDPRNETIILPNQLTILADRQLAGKQCGVPGGAEGIVDPFGLRAQFISTTPLPASSSTVASANARNGPLKSDGGTAGEKLNATTLIRFPGVVQSPNEIFLTALGPILESDLSITSQLNGTGFGKRQVIPRIIKRQVPVTPNQQQAKTSDRALNAGVSHIALQNQLCWQVQITSKSRISTSRFATATCAGGIIGASTILTAAHCLVNPFPSSFGATQEIFQPSDVRVRIGSISTNSCPTANSTNSCSETFSVSKIIKHPGYNSVLGDNDIALILLDRPINFEDKACACALCLQNSTPSVGETCMVSGFGDGLSGVDVAFPLKWSRLKTRQGSLSTSACGFNVDDATGKMSNLELFLCAGGTSGEESCQGDSGAPLVCYNQAASAYYLAGIEAFGPPCGVNIGAMYTKVAKYLPWIIANSAADVTVS